MKKFLLYIIVLLAPVLVVAQSRQLFEIDASSFAPVQTDVITGVALDKIGLDPSRRPCARIKLHVNRMNKEDIAGISVRPIGGSVVITKQIVATEGNGLIIELTAKAPTRFYLHHDKYGDSNEVSLDLEANKEYKLEAMLNTTHSIVVRSNTKGADVYIDNIFKGRISDSYNLTVSDIHPGKHTIKVKDGSLESVKDIDVNSLNIDFLVNLESVRAQFVIFEVNPKNASVIIDGKDEFPDQYGIVQLTKNNGTYSYIVSAKDYHTERGEFTVSGSKVEKSVSLRPAFGWVKVWGQGELQGANVYVDGEYIGKAPILSDKLSSGSHTIRIAKNLYKAREERIVIEDNKTLDYAPKLEADFARVTISAGEDCNIYINDKHQGKSPWRGELASGTYVFEARKNGHRSTSISKTISSTPSEQSYELPAPTPILGSIIVKSTPAMATVYIDNKQVGKTPLVQDILIGSHDITVRKEGFRDQIKNIVVSESKTTEVEFALTANQVQSASQPKTTTTVSNSTASNSNTTTYRKPSVNDDDPPFVKVEQMPSFQGGDFFTFRNWVMSQLRYPPIAWNNGISGRVLLTFVIEKDGSLTNIQVLQAPDSSLSEEAIRVLKTSPKWTPGKQRNQTVRVKYTLPVDFRIQN